MSSEPKRRVEADEFVLRDAAGTMRAALAMTVEGPGLFLYDQSGIIRARLLIGEDEPGLALFDSLGRPRVSMCLVSDEPTLRLQDAQGTSRAAIMVEPSGTRMMLSDANPGARVGIAAQSGEANLVFADPNGKPRVVLGNPGGVPGLTLLDIRGRRRAKLEIEEETSTFELYDADGKISSSRTVVWVEPRLRAADLEAQLALEAAAHKELDNALQAREKRYSALTAAMAQLVWTTNAAGEVVEDIPSWRSFTGQNEEEVKGWGWAQALHPEDRDRVEGISKQALETRSPFDVEYRARRHDGEYRDFAVRAVPEPQNDDAVHEWVFVATDISERKRLAESLRAGEDRIAALTAFKAHLEETHRASEETHSAERAQLADSLRASEERLAALRSAQAQFEETHRASEEAHSTERAQLTDSLRASEERLAALATLKAQLEETHRASDEAHTAERKRLEEALGASEEQVGALTSAKAQFEETYRASEETHAADRKRLEESLRAGQEQLSIATATKIQLEEALRASEERKNALTATSNELQESIRASESSHTAERKRLEDALRASEEHLGVLTATRAQLEESLRASEERLANVTSAKSQLEEALRVSEERHSTLTASSTQLQESLRASEESLATLTSAKTQLEETQRANEEAHAAERKRFEEALQASEERLVELTTAKAQVEETHRKCEETHTAERKRLEESLQAKDENVAALASAKAQVEETQRTIEEAHTAERKRFEEALQASEERLIALTADKAQVEETHRASEETHTAECKRLAESLRAGEESLAAMTSEKALLEDSHRASEEAHTVERRRLDESLRASEESLAALTSAKAQAEETQRANEAAHVAECKRLEEALQASEESLAALTTAKAQVEETHRTTEETHIAECKRLEEALRASEERLIAMTAAKAHLEETQRASGESLAALSAARAQLEETVRANEEAHTAERKRLEEALRASEESLATLTFAKAQLEETQRTSDETHTAECKRLEEALQASEESVASLTTAKAQIEQTHRTSEEAHSAEREQLEESLRASKESLAGLASAKAQIEEAHTAERKRLEEALQAKEASLAALTSAKAQIEETHRTSEETHTAERKRLDESLHASEERVNALTAARAQLEEALRAAEERQSTLTAATAQLQESLRASEDRLNVLSAAKSQLEETLRTSREGYAAGRAQMQEALRASEEQLSDQIVAKGHVEEKLRAREEHYRALATATAQLVWTTNAAGEMTHAAPSWMTLTGQSAEEAQGRGWFEVLHPDDRLGAEEVLKQALETRSPYKTEFRLRRHDGEYRVLAVRGAPVLGDEGAVHEWIGTAIDITDDKLAENLRRASEKKYRQIVEGAPEGIWILDPENRTTFVNPRLAQMLGWSDEEMPGKSLLDFLAEEGRESAVENLDCCRRGVAAQFDLKLRTLDGHNLHARASTLPLFDEAGQYTGALALIIDLTEQKLLEGQLQQAERLQALGQLAGGVANGLNNFLTVINGYTDLLLGKVPRSNPMHESVAQIKKAGEQAVDLVAPLLAFSQGQILWTKVLDVNEVVKEVEATLRGKLGEDIRLATELSSTLGPVKADPEQLQQVLMNLAANAAEAMRGGGSLVIETQNADLDESYAAKHPGVKPGPYVHLAVSDSGAGMSEETLAHLFEPFFTTKSPGQGAGLGLATVYGIVKQSGGSIRVESELGRGSTFHVYLPRLGEAVTLAEEEKPAVATQRGTETVLVVDDQEEIRKLAQVVLKSNGYKVVVAANGWEALLYSERHAGPIHLMLTDVVMPGMTGKELAERLRPLRPEMAVVFMSGYLESGTGALNGGAGFLSKPFSPDALATKVREVLGPPRSAGKVLVIDDQAGIRSFLRMVLVSVGYEVLEADNGEQALKNLNGDVVDLILVNLEIPSLQDVEKIRVLQKRHPELKVIAMAEAFGNDFLRAAEQLGAQATLAKPIRADQLLETLRRTTTD